MRKEADLETCGVMVTDGTGLRDLVTEELACMVVKDLPKTLQGWVRPSEHWTCAVSWINGCCSF